MSIQVEVIVTTTNYAGGEVWKGHFYSAEHDETGVTLEGSASRHGYSWLNVKMAVDDTRSSMDYVKDCGCLCCTTRRRGESK